MEMLIGLTPFSAFKIKAQGGIESRVLTAVIIDFPETVNAPTL